MFYLIAFLRAVKQRMKKAKPKSDRIKRDSNGNGCPRAEARRHRHACVSGDRKRIICNPCGTWFKEKNVPLRKDIGKITKLINRVMS